MITKSIFACVFAVMLSMVAGCATIEGLGRDISAGARTVSDAL